MPIKILRHGSSEEAVGMELMIDTIEKNRDRIREVANMSLTVSGIMVSASIAIVLFCADKHIGGKYLSLSLCVASVFFFTSACLSLYSSLLRKKYAISSKAQFVEDLLSLYYSELRFMRASLVPLFLGFFTMTVSVIVFSVLT